MTHTPDTKAPCEHKQTKIWEPHLAGARKCLDCGMVYNPNFNPRWYIEPPSLEEQLEEMRRERDEAHRLAELALAGTASERLLQCQYMVLEKAHAELRALACELARALEFYGEVGYYVSHQVGRIENDKLVYALEPTLVQQDAGKRAREALTKARAAGCVE